MAKPNTVLRYGFLSRRPVCQLYQTLIETWFAGDASNFLAAKIADIRMNTFEKGMNTQH